MFNAESISVHPSVFKKEISSHSVFVISLTTTGVSPLKLMNAFSFKANECIISVTQMWIIKGNLVNCIVQIQ